MPGRKTKPTRPAAVSPFFIGGGFVRYCVARGWLELAGAGRGARYRVTARGRTALKRFGIEV